jgi:hypothetical protein
MKGAAMEFLFRIKTERSFIEIDNDGVTLDLDDNQGMALQADASWDELRDMGNRVVRLLDPEGEIVPIEAVRDEHEEVVFPDIKQYQVPGRMFRH